LSSVLRDRRSSSRCFDASSARARASMLATICAALSAAARSPALPVQYEFRVVAWQQA